MGREFTVNLSPTAYTVSVDLAELQPADDTPVEILGFRVWQTTELGDAAEEVLTVSIVRGHTVSGSGGSSATPVPRDHRDSAAVTTAEVGNTTIANTGTTTTPYSTGWNVRAPLDVLLPPELVIRADQANTTIVLRVSAPADSTTIGASLDFREV